MNLQETENKISNLFEIVFVATGFYTEDEIREFCIAANILQSDLSALVLKGNQIDPIIKKKLEEIIDFVCG